MNLTKIQKQLEQKYPEFRSRRRLLEYYVSYEFPDKQIKLLNWWREMIESAFRYSEGVELAASDLEFLFTVHQLKPTPLVSVLNRLEIIGAI